MPVHLTRAGRRGRSGSVAAAGILREAVPAKHRVAEEAEVAVAGGGSRRAPASDHASLIVHGRDRTGIVAAVSAVLAQHDANIVSLDQYSDDTPGGAFFQRTTLTRDNLRARLPQIEHDLRARLAAG